MARVGIRLGIRGGLGGQGTASGWHVSQLLQLSSSPSRNLGVGIVMHEGYESRGQVERKLAGGT